MTVENDRSYTDATSTALGRAIGQMFQGLIETGMTRDEALEVVKTYVYGLAIKDTENDAD